MRLVVMATVEIDDRVEKKNSFEKIKNDLIEYARQQLATAVSDVKSVEVFKLETLG